MEPYDILYVDNDPNNLSGFAFLFGKKFTILLAESGEEGLEILKSNAVRLIISDFRMPEMSGLDFLRSVRKQQTHTKFILLVGHTDNHVLEEVVGDRGVFLYTKPFDSEELMCLIEDELHSYQIPQNGDQLDRSFQFRKKSPEPLVKRNFEYACTEELTQL